LTLRSQFLTGANEGNKDSDLVKKTLRRFLLLIEPYGGFWLYPCGSFTQPNQDSGFWVRKSFRSLHFSFRILILQQDFQTVSCLRLISSGQNHPKNPVL
jgi:hypothetical protein